MAKKRYRPGRDYDPASVYHTKGGANVNLASGQVDTGPSVFNAQTKYVSAKRLETLRERAGYDPYNDPTLTYTFGKMYGSQYAGQQAVPGAYTKTDRFGNTYTAYGAISPVWAAHMKTSAYKASPDDMSLDLAHPAPAGKGPPDVAYDQAPALMDAYAESDITTTGMLRAQGKSYQGISAASYLAGQTGKPNQTSTVTGGLTKEQKANLRMKGKRRKAGVKPGYHISASGNIVKNKGKRR